MKHFALGWACNLNDIFVRFPYEKCTSLIGNKAQKRQKIKQVFREGVSQVMNDIIENNITFEAQGGFRQRGKFHMEAFKGSDFETVRKRGKFQDVDFLESMFTGFQIFLHIFTKDNFVCRRKVPVYVSKHLKDKLAKYTNQGKPYC